MLPSLQITSISNNPVAVIDLQNLNLNRMEIKGARVSIGATAKLNSIVKWDETPDFLREAILKDANANLRNAATLGGSLIRLTGKSRLGIVLLAVDSRLTWEPGGMEISLGDWFAVGRASNQYRLMTGVHFDIPQTVSLESVAQTPGGFPLISVCMAKWASGRVRLISGEAGSMPEILCDGKGIENIQQVINARSHISNKYSSSTYQKAAIGTLIQRLVDEEK